MAPGAVNYIIDFFENADESADGMFNCIKNTMDSLQLDWKEFLLLVQKTQIAILEKTILCTLIFAL